jgi:SH3-like domain-containing protein
MVRLVPILAIAGGLGLAAMHWGGGEPVAQARTPAASAPAKTAAAAGAVATGSVSGLPIPRFVSLKSDKVNVRRGPGNDQDVAWVFSRAGLPVEITAEWDNWRRIRDADGAEGWVFQSLLSGRRTAVVAPWAKDPTLPLRRRADGDATVVARLQPQVLASVSECTGTWCRIWGEGFDGWIEQESLFGVYPGEEFN